jgi:regulatory protein
VASAFDDAVRMMSRRPLTRHELSERLRTRGHDAEAIASALTHLETAYGVDDLKLARDWIASRGRHRGRERVIAELAARGIPEDVSDAAWHDALAGGAIDEGDSLTAAVRRRLGAPPGNASRARLARVYNALLSEGFTRQSVEAALLPYGLERIDS